MSVRPTPVRMVARARTLTTATHVNAQVGSLEIRVRSVRNTCIVLFKTAALVLLKLFTLLKFDCRLTRCIFVDRCQRMCVQPLPEWWHVHRPYRRLHVSMP